MRIVYDDVANPRLKESVATYFIQVQYCLHVEIEFEFGQTHSFRRKLEICSISGSFVYTVMREPSSTSLDLEFRSTIPHAQLYA